MKGNISKNTQPELILRKALFSRGYRCRLNYRFKNFKVSPDIIFPTQRIAIFVDGCFWHKCPKCYIQPETNKKYWQEKIKKNIDRDKKQTSYLLSIGWRVTRIWEHEIRNNLTGVRNKIIKEIDHNF